MSISIQSVNSVASQPNFGGRRTRKRSLLKYYGSIAFAGATVGTLFGTGAVLLNRKAYPTMANKLQKIGIEAAVWGGVAVVFNGAINLFNRLVNN